MARERDGDAGCQHHLPEAKGAHDGTSLACSRATHLKWCPRSYIN